MVLVIASYLGEGKLAKQTLRCPHWPQKLMEQAGVDGEEVVGYLRAATLPTY